MTLTEKHMLEKNKKGFTVRSLRLYTVLQMNCPARLQRLQMKSSSA